MESVFQCFSLNWELCRTLAPAFSPSPLPRPFCTFVFKSMTHHSRSPPGLQGWIKFPSSVLQSPEQWFLNGDTYHNYLERLLKYMLLIQPLTEQVRGEACRVDSRRVTHKDLAAHLQNQLNFWDTSSSGETPATLVGKHGTKELSSRKFPPILATVFRRVFDTGRHVGGSFYREISISYLAAKVTSHINSFTDLIFRIFSWLTF